MTSERLPSAEAAQQARSHGADWTPPVSFKDIKNDPAVRAMITHADKSLEVLGYTEHGFRHVGLVGRWAKEILEKLGYEKRLCFLAELAGFLHDTGNLVSRPYHYLASAFFVHQAMGGWGFGYDDIYTVMGAVANHDEKEGNPASAVAAALILADKADVHKSRVRNLKEIEHDIHDRVNWAVKKSWIEVDGATRRITLNLEIDTAVSDTTEFFEIFLGRMLLCRKAARFLGCTHHLKINETEVGP